jgi:hypothetical protein
MHRNTVHTIAAIATIFAAAACNPFSKPANEIKVQDIPVGERWNATLSTPSGLQGAVQVHGTGYLARDPNGSKAVIHVSNATPGGVHPWSIRTGLCGSADNPVYGDASAYPNLKVDKDGTAQTSATLSAPFPSSGDYSLEMRASPTNTGTIIACGNLAPPTQ